MAATSVISKRYLDKDGLETLIGQIKAHINDQAQDKIKEIKYNSTSKQLQWTKDGKNWSNIDVKTWVNDIYLNSIGLSASGEITLKLNEAGGSAKKTIDLKTWFNPSAYLTTSNASTYLKKDDASKAYLSTSAAQNGYITSITTLTSTEVTTLWDNTAATT